MPLEVLVVPELLGADTACLIFSFRAFES